MATGLALDAAEPEFARRSALYLQAQGYTLRQVRQALFEELRISVRRAEQIVAELDANQAAPVVATTARMASAHIMNMQLERAGLRFPKPGSTDQLNNRRPTEVHVLPIRSIPRRRARNDPPEPLNAQRAAHL